MKTLLCTAAMAIALAAGPALAQTKATTDSPAAATAKASLSPQDREFVTKAAQSGKAEVEFGKLATKKASSQDVRTFSQSMLDDHGKSNEQLKRLAGKKDAEVPAQLDDENRQLHERLAGLSGDQFDRQYMQAMVDDHEKAIGLFEAQSKEGQDADLKRFATETLPVLEQHLDMAQDIRQRMQPMASSSTSEAAPSGSQSGATAVTQGSAATTTAPASSASASSASGSSAADSSAAAGPGTTAPAATTAAAGPQIDRKLGAMTADQLLGKGVVNAEGKEIGEIEDVVVDGAQNVHAVVAVGGFLGIGEKDVLVPFHRFRIGENQAVMMSETSEEELKKLPAYDKQGYEAVPRERPILDR